jgi:hypothetical protein
MLSGRQLQTRRWWIWWLFIDFYDYTTFVTVLATSFGVFPGYSLSFDFTPIAACIPEPTVVRRPTLLSDDRALRRHTSYPSTVVGLMPRFCRIQSIICGSPDQVLRYVATYRIRIASPHAKCRTNMHININLNHLWNHMHINVNLNSLWTNIQACAIPGSTQGHCAED